MMNECTDEIPLHAFVRLFLARRLLGENDVV